MDKLGWYIRFKESRNIEKLDWWDWKTDFAHLVCGQVVRQHDYDLIFTEHPLELERLQESDDGKTNDFN